MQEIKEQDIDMLKQVCKNTDPQAYAIVKRIAAYLHNNKNKSKPTSLYLMLDAAKWTYDEMMKNLNSTAAKSIKKWNEKYVYHMNKSLDPGKTYLPNLGTTVEQIEHEDLGLIAKLEAYKEWITQVNSGNPWDLKVQKTPKNSKEYLYDPCSKTSYRRDIWGNVHYGYIGKAVGFADFELHGGAGVAQIPTIWRQSKKGDHEALKGALKRVLKYYGNPAAIDPPDDKAAVQVGIDLWAKKSSSLDFATFVGDIRANKGPLPTK